MQNPKITLDIKRLFDGFFYPDIIIEVKTINSSSRSIAALGGGPLCELIGQAMSIKDFNPDYKIISIILGNEAYNSLLHTKDIILKYVDKVYTTTDLFNLKNYLIFNTKHLYC